MRWSKKSRKWSFDGCSIIRSIHNRALLTFRQARVARKRAIGRACCCVNTCVIASAKILKSRFSRRPRAMSLASSPPVSRSMVSMRMVYCAPKQACIASCANHRLTHRVVATHRLPQYLSIPKSMIRLRLTSTPRICVSIPTVLRARAVNTLIKPIRRCASRTSRPIRWCSVRTTAHNTKTAPKRCRC